MVFSSPIFLFLFLPIVLIIYFSIKKSFRNAFLLFSSLFFYAWGEGTTVAILACSILFNFYGGLLLHKLNRRELKVSYFHQETIIKLLLGFGVGLNLLSLLYYKYIAFFGREISAFVAFPESMKWIYEIGLPIGISFFTFQGLSYLIDVYRKDIDPAESAFDFGCYLASFPQLIAGPIVRYKDIQVQLYHRSFNIEEFSIGVERFIIGLGKKVLIADALGATVDQIVSLDPSLYSFSLSWTVALFYSLQIYFDFSAYSDMAIGLGKMFGFTFLENFNFPYISKSIQEFWRRWHISLSSWFRDYLYIPLGGNRMSPWRVNLNLLTVFVLCGFWHGASWNYVIWGLYHGLFLMLERGRFGNVLLQLPVAMRHVYAIIIVVCGWVIFRFEDMGACLTALRSMFGLSQTQHFLHPFLFISHDAAIAFVVATALSISQFGDFAKSTIATRYALIFKSCRLFFLLLVFTISLSKIAMSTYSPFLYFRF